MLYEVITLVALNLVDLRLEERQLRVVGKGNKERILVITSYSIHYTKLYDGEVATLVEPTVLDQAAADAGAQHHHYPVATLGQTAAPGFRQGGAFAIVFDADGQGTAGLQVGHQISYNFV